MAHLSRRRFVADAASCAGHLALAAAATPGGLRKLWARTATGRTVAREPFGALERVGEGTWAMISTPLGGDRTTVCNGGIVAGRDAVLVIEGFFQPQGARWVAEQAHQLTGRWPTHLALTHWHADHANGITGYGREEGGAPALRATEATRDQSIEANRANAATVAALREAELLPPGVPSVLDLGGRVVRAVPLDGHTTSDLALEVEDQSVLFGGDLIWNGMFPNYVNATPSRLSVSVRALRREATTLYVPGHGGLARQSDLNRYLDLLDEVERAARNAHRRGASAAEAGAQFTLPATLGEWVLFSPAFFERAFGAWYRELAP